MNITPEAKAKQLVVYIPDTSGVTLSHFGRGNLKIGLDGVYTFSRLPGKAHALGLPEDSSWKGTCPGATEECQAICYAARPVAELGPVSLMWLKNSLSEDVPTELPPDAKLVRLHVSGDFTSEQYINGWTDLFTRNPKVRMWVYTRSWRIATLLPALERLRALPNVQMFASMDVSTKDFPPVGWRRAWIDGDPRAGVPLNVPAHSEKAVSRNLITYDGARSYVCPEETGHRVNCEECRYCIDGKKNDVTFLKH